MGETMCGYSVTAGPAADRDERFTASYHLRVDTVWLVQDWADAAGVTPADVIDVAVRQLVGQLALLARPDEEGEVDEYGRAWLRGWFR